MSSPHHARRHASGPTHPSSTRVTAVGAVVALVVGVLGGAGAASAALGDPLLPLPEGPAPVVADAPESVGAVREEPAASRSSDRSATTPAVGEDSGPGAEEGAEAGTRDEPEPTPVVVDPTPRAETGSGLLSTEPTPPTGVFVVASGETPAPGVGTVRTVRIEVEQGLPVDVDVFAAAVMATLNDPRGWSTPDGVTFARTEAEDASIRVLLATPETTDALCAPLRTNGKYSCGTGNAAVLNLTRWVEGSPDFGGDMAVYRQYVVNHEVGHVLGHHHEQCPAPGALAPVMVQQSISAQGCQVNGWPFPEAVPEDPEAVPEVPVTETTAAP